MRKIIKAVEIEPHHCLIDVRTPREFEALKVSGSSNYPLGDLEDWVDKLPGKESLVLVCATGIRAQKAQEALSSHGISSLILEKGISEWQSLGLPVELGVQRGLSLERQVRIIAGAIVATGSLLALVIDPLFAIVPAAVGSGLVFAGVTDTCGMAMLLAKLPYNTRESRETHA